MVSKNLLEVIEQERKITKTVGRYGDWCAVGRLRQALIALQSKTAVETTFLKLQEKEVCRNLRHSSAGKVSQVNTELHPVLTGSVTLIWTHP